MNRCRQSSTENKKKLLHLQRLLSYLDNQVAALAGVFLLLLASLTAPALAQKRMLPLLADEPPASLMRTYSYALAQEDYSLVEATINRLKSGRGGDGTIDLWGELLTASWSVARPIDLGGNQIGYRGSVSMKNAREGFEILETSETDPKKLAAIEEALGNLDMLEAQIRGELEGRTLASLGPASDAVKHFRRAVALDSTRLNALAGTLIYEYWKSNALGIISWMPFVPDHRSASIKGLYRVVHSDHYAAPGAALALSWVLIESGRFDDAAALADSLLDQWGDVRGLLEPAGKAYFLMERWDEAADRYTRLAKSVRAAPSLNETRLIGALHRLGHIETARGNWQAVINASREAHALELTDQQRQRKQDDLERLKGLEEEAIRHLDDQSR